MDLTAAIEQAAENADFGIATARKSGRNPKFPYVPVIQHTEGGRRGDGYQAQIVRLAYETRAEAVSAAEQHIARNRAALANRLATPGNRALREQHGLPREIR